MQYVAEEYHLHVEINTQECTIPTDIRTEMQPAMDRIGQAVQDFPESHFWLMIVHHPRSNTYHAQAKLKVPGETIITGDWNEHMGMAIARCLDKVLNRVQSYKANSDEHTLKQAEANARLTSELVPPAIPDAARLESAVQHGDYQEFRQALIGQEESLRMRAGRWVQRYPEVQDEVGRTFEIADLVEEVFLMAFEQYPHRPTHLTFHEWLDNLLDPAIKSLIRDPDEKLAAHIAQSTQRPEF